MQSFSRLLYGVPHKQPTRILIIACNFSRKALQFMHAWNVPQVFKAQQVAGGNQEVVITSIVIP
jgi:hypothetical protein